MSFLDNLDNSFDTGQTSINTFSNDDFDYTSSSEELVTNVFLAKASELEAGIGNLYQSSVLAEKTFTHEKESALPDNLVSVLMTKKKGSNEIQLKTSAEYADKIQRLNNIQIHAKTKSGETVVKSISQRNITVGKMSDEEYAQIHNAAMRSLSLLAEKYRELADAAENDGPSTTLSRYEYTILTGRKEKQLPVGGLFPTNLPRSHPLSKAKLEQLRDEEAFEEEAIKKVHVKKRDDTHAQRLVEHKIKGEKTEDILHLMIKRVQRGKPGKSTHKI